MDNLEELVELRKKIIENNNKLSFLKNELEDIERKLKEYRIRCQHEICIKHYNMDTNKNELYCLCCGSKIDVCYIDNDDIIDFTKVKYDAGYLTVDDKCDLAIDIMGEIESRNPDINKVDLIKEVNNDIKSMDTPTEYKILNKIYNKI